MKRLGSVATAALVLVVIGGISGAAATVPPSPGKQELAMQLLHSPAARFMTAPALAALNREARGSHGSFRPAPGSAGMDQVQAPAGPLGAAPAGIGLPNVRVNDPGEDGNAVGQTTQSETSIAVVGATVVVGFNDSQRVWEQGTDLDGLAYSSDGGQTFTDAGVLPNRPGFVNEGDPWLARDGAGNVYYSSLAFDLPRSALTVGVAKSNDAGKSWLPMANAAAGLEQANFFYYADKDALASGPSGLYDSWTDFTVTNFHFFSGLAVAGSTNGGTTWSAVYVSQIPTYPGVGCDFQQYTGAQPLVTPDSTVLLAAELIRIRDPKCTGTQPVTVTQVFFASNNGGKSWMQKDSNAVASSTQGLGFFQLGGGQFMRNQEFPTLATFGGALYMAWNDGGDGSGHSHIKLARSNGGTGWTSSYVTSGSNDEIQPALSADSSGLHLLYYELSNAAAGCVGGRCVGGSPGGDGGSVAQLDVVVSNSTAGASWVPRRVTSQSFPGVFTLPPFDPAINIGYMGDYIANVSDGGHQYFAWGDNRDIVTDWLWPQGRHDPDVFEARQ